MSAPQAQQPQPRRPPGAAYRKRNGFTEISTPSTDTAKKFAGVNSHRFAQFILDQEEGHYFPSRDAMKDAVAAEESADALSCTKTLQSMHEHHLQDLEHLYTVHAHEYHQEALDRYLSVDDEMERFTPGIFPARQKFYSETRRSLGYLVDMWTDEVSRLRYAHLSTVLPVQSKRAALELRDTAERRRQDALFPESVAAFWAISNKVVQLRVAKFLMSDDAEKEKILSQFGWVWRQVQQLCDEYSKNPEFQSKIQALRQDLEARDPRKRPTG